ncbi:MAG: hypothetical protein HY246_22340 [Proteobacteria bacterium]|nr:hypothetical protein [Pseudomonadota bacterium]
MAARRYAASLMSNAKWRKLFRCIDQPELGGWQCIFKFVGNDQARQMRTPNRRAVSYRSSGIVDSVEVGPIPFREIEWIEFPRHEIPSGYKKCRRGGGRRTSMPRGEPWRRSAPD